VNKTNINQIIKIKIRQLNEEILQKRKETQKLIKSVNELKKELSLIK